MHSTIPQVYPRSIVFDFEINEEFKLSQVASTYFIDSDTEEVVYFWPLAQQVIVYNYQCYFKWKLKSIMRSPETYNYMAINRGISGQNDQFQWNLPINYFL